MNVHIHVTRGGTVLKRRITRNTGTGTYIHTCTYVYHNNVKRKTLYVYFLYNGTHIIIIIIHKNVEEEGTYYVYISLGTSTLEPPGLVHVQYTSQPQPQVPRNSQFEIMRIFLFSFWTRPAGSNTISIITLPNLRS